MDIAGFKAALGPIEVDDSPEMIRRKSMDMSGKFSPLMKEAMKGRQADLIVTARCRADLLRIASAAAVHKVPLVLRGAGTANLGQGIPLNGGAIVDTRGVNRVIDLAPGQVTVEPGARISAIDDAARKIGWELRMHPSTKRMATIGGYIGGGHAGVGSCAWGILRDTGNIRSITVASVEEQPRIVKLEGSDVNLVHHAYGTNGIILELGLPLTHAWRWRETVAAFPSLVQATRFAYELYTSDGILRKLISTFDAPLPRMIRPLAPYLRDGEAMVLTMTAMDFDRERSELVARHQGRIAVEAEEGRGPYGFPIYEFSWGHARHHINHTDPDLINLIGLFPSSDPVAAILRLAERTRAIGPLQFEAKRFDGQLAFQGSPFFRYESETQLAEILSLLRQEGLQTANNQTWDLKQGGMKPITDRDLAFKRDMDPQDLLNPGKFPFPGDVGAIDSGAALPSSGWAYRGQESV
ncbi:MAG: FAD-binding oxidoreductase [Qingshengfaniella sp.]